MNPFDEFDADFQASQALVRIFPLPNYVPFPGIRQPLHLFEPRYVSLMDDLLETPSRLLTLAVLRPGWKECYNEKSCPIYPIGVVGQTDNIERSPDGRYNFLWTGMSRCRILSEVSDEHAFRTGKVELISEVMDAALLEKPEAMKTMAWDLVEHFKAVRPDVTSDKSFSKVINENLPLPLLTDLLAFLLKLEQELIYPFLSELDVMKRSRNLAELMSLLRPSSPKFPPNFSEN